MELLVYKASAGSGKTFTLAVEYIKHLIENPRAYRQILAVTFTNKATAEMKERIVQQLYGIWKGDRDSEAYLNRIREDLKEDMDTEELRKRAGMALQYMLHDYSRFRVETIDSFFQSVMRNLARELELTPNLNIELNNTEVLDEAVDSLIEKLTPDAPVMGWLLDYINERIADDKRWNVSDEIKSFGRNIFDESYLEKGGLLRECLKEPQLMKLYKEALKELETEALEQMKAFNDQFEGELEGYGLAPEDLKNGSRGIGSYFRKLRDGRLSDKDVVNATLQGCLANADNWSTKSSKQRKGITALAERSLMPLLQEAERMRPQRCRTVNSCRLTRQHLNKLQLLNHIDEEVKTLNREQNRFLLSDTNALLHRLVREGDSSFVFEKIGASIRNVMIDEFQDTSLKEWENFLPLLGNAMAQSEQTSVLIVGDIKQSIYRWRGGDWEILHRRAARELGEASTETIHLKENFRSLPLVVEFNNRMIGKVVESDNTALNQLLAQAPPHALGEKAREELRDTLQEAYREHAQSARKKGLHPGYVNITHYTGEPPLIERIKALVDKGFRPKDMMILVRSGTDGAKVASALLDFKRRNTDPRYRFDVMTQEALIVGTAPISSFVIACLKLAMNPADSLSRAIYNHFSAKPSFDAELTEEEVVFLKSLRLFPPEEAFERIVMRYDLQERREEIAYLQAVHEQIINFCAGRVADIPLFLKWWDEQGSGRSLSVEQGETTIEITTIHKAKGLEKKVVLIPYCNWTLNPKSSGLSANIVWAESTDGELEEIGRFPVRYKTSMGESLFSAHYYREMIYAHVDNINLLYVALTRAVESLHIFIPQKGAKGPNVGQLILQNIAPEDGTVRLDGLEGSYSRDEAAETYEFGEFAGPEPDTHRKAKAAHVLLGDYPTSEPQLQLRLPTERYYEEEGRAELTPRDFGILMHRVFENAATTDEIYMAIEAMTQDGVLDEKEAPRLRELVEKALADPVTAEWFGGRWQVVRNENEIILPGSGTTRRPDRVMTDGERAVVVDYKFGDRETARHRKQIREYLRLLRQMGYTRTEGYLWYVRLGRTERVEEKED